MPLNEKRFLPIAAASSGGNAAASAPFFLVPEELVEQTELFRQNVLTMILSPSPEKADQVTKSIETMAVILDGMRDTAAGSAHTIQKQIVETARKQSEQTLRLLQELPAAKNPAEVFALQTEYAVSLLKQFAASNQSIRSAWLELALMPWAAVTTRDT